MSVIAWDGRIIAADMISLSGGKIGRATKLDQFDSEVIGWVGELAVGLMLRDWYLSGAEKADFPEAQKDKDRRSTLIVADINGCNIYDSEPVAIPVEDKFCAWGCGEDFATGAMAAGRSAVESIEIAIKYCNGCGVGITAFDLTNLNK